MEKKVIVKSTLLVTIFSLLNIVISFFTQVVVAYFFGTGIERDAYFAASVLPTYIATIYTGSMGVVFLPLLMDLKVNQPTKVPHFISRSINLSLSLLMIVFLTLLFFRSETLRYIAPGFDKERSSLATSILLILLPTIFLQGLSSILISLFHAENRFACPAVSTILTSTVTFTFVICFNQQMGIHSLAFGTLAGWTASTLMLLPFLRRQFRYSFSLGLREQEIKAYVKAAFPLVLAGIIYRSNTIFERMFASLLPIGSISYLGYANQVVAIFTTITTQGIVTTLFPLLSKAWTERNLDLLKRYYRTSLRVIFVICIPISMLYITFKIPFTRIIFERGSFNHESTVAVGMLISIMMGTFIFASINSITSKLLYITKQSTIGAINGVAELIIYVILSFALLKHLSYAGLAIAQVAAAGISAFGAILIIEVKHRILDRSIFFDFLRIIFAGGSQFVLMNAAVRLVPDLNIFLVFAIGSAGISLYVAILFLLRIEETESLKTLLNKYFVKT